MEILPGVTVDKGEISIKLGKNQNISVIGGDPIHKIDFEADTVIIKLKRDAHIYFSNSEKKGYYMVRYIADINNFLLFEYKESYIP